MCYPHTIFYFSRSPLNFQPFAQMNWRILNKSKNGCVDNTTQLPLIEKLILSFEGNSLLVAWQDVCLPKSIRGLGVRPAYWFNLAALTKLEWRVLTKSDNWLAQIISSKYLWRNHFLVVRKKATALGAWSGILKPRKVLLHGLRWFDNHKSILVWSYN